jgi:hypothetical protein
VKEIAADRQIRYLRRHRQNMFYEINVSSRRSGHRLCVPAPA